MSLILRRFLDAQVPVWDSVVAELEAGRKVGHWMWFIFPQLKGLGRSERAIYFGLNGLGDARAYMAHPVLGGRLEICGTLALTHKDRSAEEIFGAVDAMKLRSCATLFLKATEMLVFEALLDQFFSEPCPATERLLARAQNP